MALDGATIAAIITGILALLGALATAWLSGWNEERLQRRKNMQIISQHSMPLLIAAWDLHNWLYDILDAHNYSRLRTDAYGDGWNSRFTSYLMGKYFAAVHIIGVRTQYFSFVRGGAGERLKIALWKVQDEWCTMNHEERRGLEMRWFEGDVLAVQEHLTVPCGEKELQVLGWTGFLKDYEGGPKLREIFAPYEEEFQRIVYRRFKRAYPGAEDRCPAQANPAFDRELASSEREWALDGKPIVPDHRIRRLQHLLADVVDLADELSFTRLRRPVRRWDPSIVGEGDGQWVACDCWWAKCRPEVGSFWWRPKDVGDSVKGFSDKMAVRRHESMPLQRHAKEAV